MAFREVSVSAIREVLRLWLGVVPGLPAPGLRTIAGHCGLDRKTVRRYVDAAQAAGLRRDSGVEAIDDGLIGAVAEAVRPVRPHGHGAAWEQLLGFEKQITGWVAGDKERRPLTVTKIHEHLHSAKRSDALVLNLHRDGAITPSEYPRAWHVVGHTAAVNFFYHDEG